MASEPFVVSCGMCSRPFLIILEPGEGRPNAAGLPGHRMLGPRGEEMRVDCAGASLPPMMHPTVERWEAWWVN